MMTRVKIWLLVSMWISNVGEWVYFIALNMIVLRLTDSPFAVSVLYMLTPIAAVMTNSWAGSLIDRIDTKKLLVILNVNRAVLVLILSAVTNISLIYGISFILQMMNAVFATASFVYMTKLIETREQQRFNAWKNFVQSSGFILGPSIAGLLFLIGTPQLAIAGNGIALVVSAVIIWYLPNVKKTATSTEKVTLQVIRHDWKKTALYSRKERFVTIIYILVSAIIVSMTALDSLEAAFAQKELDLTETAYGLLVSIAGLGFLIGSFLNTKWQCSPLLSMKYGAVFIAIGYLIYAISHQLYSAAVGCFLLTFAHCYVNIGFITYIQRKVPTELLGRVTSVFGLFESLGTFAFVLVFGIAADQQGLRTVVIAGSLMLLLLALCITALIQYTNKKIVIEK
jgi:MFS family permease